MSEPDLDGLECLVNTSEALYGATMMRVTTSTLRRLISEAREAKRLREANRSYGITVTDTPVKIVNCEVYERKAVPHADPG